MRNKLDLSLYLITDQNLTNGRPLEDIVQQAIDGGATIVQIREKKASTKDFLHIASNILELTRTANIPLIINDRIDIALAIGADGVHLGQDDIPCEAARKILGANAIIGLSTTNPAQAEATNKLDIDYIGGGPIFFTNTKENCRPPIGFEGLTNICKASKHKVCAIGGIKLDNCSKAIESGASGVAVVSAIMQAENPRATSQGFINKIKIAKLEANRNQ
jgi:thiamine-phosphate pyrophosphorylase